MSGKVKCTCGWSWNKSDSSVKDMYICHECGRDNSNNMKNGGWLDNIDKAQTGKKVEQETEVDRAKRVARKVASTSGVGLALDQFPGAETAYDLYNIVDAYKQGDPMKIIPNVMGALLPGLSGKSFEAISDEYLPKTPRKVKEKIKAVLKGKRASVEEIKKAQESVDWSTGFKKLYDDVGEIGTGIKNTIDDTVTPLMGLKNGGWLDNYNDSSISLPEGYVGEGIFNGPIFENPAVKGQFQMGGNIPGAVGHMYARHGSPSKGPRRNQTDVTDASAQNGKEMQYYQEGLDWKPKTISKNGAWLDQYDVAQTGTKKFKLKDERELAYKPAESTNVKKKNFDLEQSKSNKSYINQLAAQQKEDKRRKALTKDQREREDYNARNEERGSIQAPVKESKWDRTKAIVSNPLTAFGYAARNESLPTRFQFGERNTLDNAIDWINPLQGVAALSEIPGELGRGEYMNAGLSALDALDLGVYAKGAMKASKPLLQKAGQQLGNVRTSIAPELRQGLRTAGPSFGSSIDNVGSSYPSFKQITNAPENIDTEHLSGLIKKEADWLRSPEYLKRKMSATGRSEASIKKESEDIINNINNTSINYTGTAEDNVSGLYSSGKNPKIQIFDGSPDYYGAEHPFYTGVLDHEVKHAFSETAAQGDPVIDYITGKGYKNYPKANLNKNLSDKISSAFGMNWANLAPEQQVTGRRMMDVIENTQGVKRGTGLTDSNIEGLITSLKNDRFDNADMYHVALEFKKKFGDSYQKHLKDFLNKAWVGVPAAVGLGATSQIEQKRDGGIIKDDRGQWDHPGEITEIGSNQITMQGVPYPVLGISDTGDTQMMYPNQEYQYNGSSVTEFPMAQNGLRQEQKGLQNLDNLVNFTNYNTKQPGGWLEKFATGGSVTEVSPEEYTIEEGNTLFEIARDKNVPLSTLAAANKIENPDLIKTGNKLAIPKQFKKELSFNEIPTIDNKKIVIDNFSPHYDYIIEGDKTYYKVKSGNTWADISNNKQARANLTTFLDKNNYWAGYGSGEKAKYDKVHHQPVVVPGSKIPKTQPSIIKNTETGNKPVIVKRPIAKVAKEEPSFFDDISDVVSSSVKSLETKWGDVKKETKNIVKDVENTISSGLNNAISTTEDAYHTVLNGIERKFKTHTGQDDDAKVTTKVNLNPKTVKEWYGNKSGAEITQVIDAPNTNGRTYKQQVLPASNIKFGVRNRGEYKDIKTDGLEVTTFNPFTKDKLPDETSVLAIDGKGNLHTGQYKDFKGQKDFMFSKTFRNKIIDFPEVNGKGQYISGEKSGNPKYQQPKIKVLDDKGKVVDGSLNILVKDDSKKDYYGQVQGGRILFVNPTTKEQYLVSGSMNHIKQKFKELKGNNKYLEAYTLDNGTYSRGLSYKDKKLTKDRLKSYDLENTGGGNGLYILDYKQPVSKYEEDYIDNMPNIRTKNDTSYKKGHALKNEVKNIVLHHTAYTGPNAEKELNKQYMTPGQNSSHIVIQENGKRSVYASPEQVTFHAGESEWNKRKDVNDFSIGVEFQGDTNKKPLTQAQIESFVEYYAPIAKKYNLSLKDVITHQMVAPGRKPDINEKQYSRILKYMREKNFK